MGRTVAALATALLVLLAGCSVPLSAPSQSPATPTATPGDEQPTGTPGIADGRPSITVDNVTVVFADGYDPDYDVAAVLQRVERLRGLAATAPIVIHERDPEPREAVDVREQFGYVGPVGAQFLQLDSSERVRFRPNPGVTTYGQRAMHVRLLNASALQRAYGWPQELVLAHEFVHVLQAQHDLIDPGRPRGNTTDATLASTVLREGDATLVAAQYASEYGPDAIPVDVYNATAQPRFVRDASVRAWWPVALSNQPYHVGYRYLASTDISLAERNARLKDPFETTASYLHPGTSAQPQSMPAPVTNETADFRVRDRLGELAIRFALRANGVAYGAARAAASGWRGDTIYYYELDGKRPVYWRTAWANASEAREFLGAWRTMLRANGATRSDGTWIVPGTATTTRTAYRLRRDGATVHVTGGVDEAAVGQLARLWHNASKSETAQ